MARHGKVLSVGQASQGEQVQGAVHVSSHPLLGPASRAARATWHLSLPRLPPAASAFPLLEK